jgi:hypothetical protein
VGLHVEKVINLLRQLFGINAVRLSEVCRELSKGEALWAHDIELTGLVGTINDPTKGSAMTYIEVLSALYDYLMACYGRNHGITVKSRYRIALTRSYRDAVKNRSASRAANFTALNAYRLDEFDPELLQSFVDDPPFAERAAAYVTYLHRVYEQGPNAPRLPGMDMGNN